MKSSSILRIRLLSGGIVIVAAILLSKLYLVQIVQGDFFTDRADRQYASSGRAIFNRGAIDFKDKTGNLVSAATLKTGFGLAINPRLLINPEEAYQKINKIYAINESQFMAKARKPDDPYEEIAHHLPLETGEVIAALDIAGVILEKERWRFYPGETLAAQTLGLVGYKGDDFSGRYGLERYYNDVLSRNEGNIYENFFAQIFSDINDKLAGKSGVNEGDLVLTIEPTVESFLTEELRNISHERSADQVGGVIINPVNGEIYAIAVLPDFNPNNFQDEESPRVFSNPIVDSVFEMGSIIKPLTMAAGIDSEAVTAKTTYFDKGFIVLNNRRIENYDGKGRGMVDMQHVLNESLNTGAAFVAAKMGNQKFADYMRTYGLGEETGIDLPNEAAGLVDNLKSNRDVEYATASFGQGIALTPIATVRALSSLSNGGILVTPHVVKEIRLKLGVNKKISYGEGQRVIKKETSDEITRMLVKVVDEALIGGKAKLQNYSVAAKTGTAQIAREGGGGYYEDKFLHSFFGYFPAYEPRFFIFLYALNPKGVSFASGSLTEPFSQIVKFLINYYDVPPDR